jgi:predicted metal-dependent hydrolase
MDITRETFRPYWFNSDIVKSHFFNAASMTFPGTEPFVVEAVKYYRDQIVEEFLKSEVDRLIFEEIGHTEIHGNVNHVLSHNGYNANGIQKMVVILMKLLWKLSSHKTRLAVAVGIEHYSTVLAKTVLEHDLMKSADKNVRDMWYWHTYEEVRHRSVSFDVYEEIGGG